MSSEKVTIVEMTDWNTLSEIQANQFLLLLIKCCVLSCEAANTNFKVIKIVPDLNKEHFGDIQCVFKVRVKKINLSFLYGVGLLTENYCFTERLL